MYNLHLHHIPEAFKDFYSIESNTLFPKQLIQDEIYPTLTHVQKVCIETQEFYKSAPESRRIYQDHSNSNSMILSSINSMDLTMSEFELIDDLCNNNNNINNLLTFLALNKYRIKKIFYVYFSSIRRF